MFSDEDVSFNPCFNGTYSLTNEGERLKYLRKTCFNPCFNGTYSLTITPNYTLYVYYLVLILVLMELTL